jgi:hypothetical protein
MPRIIEPPLENFREDNLRRLEIAIRQLLL